MKNILIIALLVLYCFNFPAYNQEVTNRKYNTDKPIFIIPKNHNRSFSDLKKSSSKSFYESKSDWQHIIDTTWGPGASLSEKLLIYNTYALAVHDKFDGFNSLQLNWDSLYNHYLSKINESTSKGSFSSIMSHFAYDLKDMHTKAYDSTVVFTPLNPGVPVLLMGSYLSVEHFGAVTTILPDSTTLVLRVVPNHPLNLDPGDIIIGYEGIPWKNLIRELLDAGLPMLATTGGCKTADTYLNLSGAGLNWHLFNTIDILKHSNGDTVHLSVLPLLNLNVPPMANNEQLRIQNIPFPDVLPWPVISDTVVTYGILENTNIGYIFLAMEYLETTADVQFYNAINALKNTDALIIDMRLNFGGWALYDNAFNILFNEFHKTIEDAYRCNSNTFELCPSGNWDLYKINGLKPAYYDRPIAVLLGPSCVSMGDVTAQRLRYHPMVSFLGKSSNASLGDNVFIYFPGWFLRYSISDMFHTYEPGNYLNRREFPIDYPVWFNADDVANGEDPVVNKAIEWIQNLSYAHNVLVNPDYFIRPAGTATLTAKVENPNGHNLSVNARITSTDNIITDTVSLFDDGNHNDGDPGDGTWGATWPVPAMETIFTADMTYEDSTAGSSRSITGAAKFTSIGPVVVDGITYAGTDTIPNCGDVLLFKVALRNNGLTASAVKVSAELTSLDTTLADFINYNNIAFANIAPGKISTNYNYYKIGISENCPVNTAIPVKVEISSDLYTFWSDTFAITVRAPVNTEDISTPMTRIYPNPAYDIINIEMSNTGEQEIVIELLTVSGKLIYRKDYKNSRNPFVQQIDLSGYAKGVYFLRISQTGAIYNGKIIVM